MKTGLYIIFKENALSSILAVVELYTISKAPQIILKEKEILNDLNAF